MTMRHSPAPTAEAGVREGRACRVSRCGGARFWQEQRGGRRWAGGCRRGGCGCGRQADRAAGRSWPGGAPGRQETSGLRGSLKTPRPASAGRSITALTPPRCGGRQALIQAQMYLKPISSIFLDQMLGPTAWMLLPWASTATATGMSSTLNSWMASMPRSSKAITRALLMALDTR